MVGFFFAYIGAVMRWLFSDRKKSINYFYTEEGDNDSESILGSSLWNRLIGIVTIVLLLFIVGSFL